MLIWTSKIEVTTKRRTGSRIPGSLPVLTLDHEKSRIDPKYLAADNVQHTVEKVATRATTLLQTALPSEVCLQSYEASKSQESRWAGFRDSRAGVLGVPGEKSHLDVGPVENHRVYYKGEGGGFPQVRAVVSLVCPCCPWLS